MNITEFCRAVESKTGTPLTKSGQGFVAKCPAHDDQRPSLSVSEGSKGIVLKCHRGCTFEEITTALGIQAKEMFNESATQVNGNGRFNIDAIYPYTNAEGKLLYEVCRLAPKGFRQRRPDPTAKDGYSWNLNGVQPVPYRLPQLIEKVSKGETIYIAEGEKDVATLVAQGYAATCNSGGAGKWKPEFGELFKGARAVVIIADRDTPGRNHAASVAASVSGKAQSVKVIELPDISGRQVKDATGFFEAGGTCKQLQAIIQAEKQFDPAQHARPQVTPTDKPTTTPEPAERITGKGLVRLADEPRAEAVPLYYYAERSRWYAPDNRGGYFPISDAQAKSFLAEYGFNKRVMDGQGNTIAERAMIWKMQNAAVAYAGELAGYPAGCHNVAGSRILVTRSPQLITPAQGHHSIITKLIETMFADEEHDQLTYFVLWLSTSYKAFLERMQKPENQDFRHCPALYIAGPRRCGKTALIELILTPLFGGRQADPMNYLREPKFNKDLFGAALLVLDDKGAGTSITERRQRGEAIKDLIWKPEQRMEGKNLDAIRLRPFWRLVIAGNDDEGGLQVCPALAPSLQDKLLILRARPADGLPTTNEENDVWAKAIRAELPAFAHFLLNWKPPEGLQLDERTRVKIFWHPQIESALRDLQPEMRLLELIDNFKLHGTGGEPWEGTATEFQSAMKTQDIQGMADRIFVNGTTAGRMLSELARMLPDRVKKTDRSGTSYYRIFPPVQK